jgi:histidine triad (HIT) family protein
MKIAEAIRKSDIKSEGINFHLADGSAAGQEIFHVHLHVIPRFTGNGFGFKFARGRAVRPPKTELDETAEKIRTAL